MSVLAVERLSMDFLRRAERTSAPDTEIARLLKQCLPADERWATNRHMRRGGWADSRSGGFQRAIAYAVDGAHVGAGACAGGRWARELPGGFQHAVAVASQIVAHFECADHAGYVSDGGCRKIVHERPPLRFR
jgi:hypothetical protein